MKRFLAILTALVLTMGLTCSVAMADTAASADVYVSISDEGKLVLPYAKVTVTDTNADGKLTTNDALFCAHETYFEGGAAAGFATSYWEGYGNSCSKLWGDTSGWYGYYKNHQYLMNLDDAISAGDHVKAFINEEQNWLTKDIYTYFDCDTKIVTVGENIELTLNKEYEDANYNRHIGVVADAKLVIDTTVTDKVTDINGKVTFSFDKAGTYLVSAASGTDTGVLVPPVCIVTVKEAPVVPDQETPADTEKPADDTDKDPVDKDDKDTKTADAEKSPQTGDDFNTMPYVIIALAALAVCGGTFARKKAVK